MTKREGIVYDMDEAEYHAPVNELSSTGAKLLLESPAKYKHQIIDGNRVHRDAYNVGTAVHTKILGVGKVAVSCPPGLLDKTGGMRTAAAKEWKAEQEALGVPVVSSSDMADIDGMAEAVLAHPIARKLFERPGNAEVSIFDEIRGVRRRGRIDYLPDDGGVAVDLKTTVDASRDGFANSAAKYAYHLQRAHYLDILERVSGRELDMRFVLVEKNAPYLVAVRSLNQEFAEMGQVAALEAVDVYARCVRDGDWPGYPLDDLPVQPPVWSVYQHQDRYEQGDIQIG